MCRVITFPNPREALNRIILLAALTWDPRGRSCALLKPAGGSYKAAVQQHAASPRVSAASVASAAAPDACRGRARGSRASLCGLSSAGSSASQLGIGGGQSGGVLGRVSSGSGSSSGAARRPRLKQGRGSGGSMLPKEASSATAVSSGGGDGASAGEPLHPKHSGGANGHQQQAAGQQVAEAGNGGKRRAGSRVRKGQAHGHLTARAELLSAWSTGMGPLDDEGHLNAHLELHSGIATGGGGLLGGEAVAEGPPVKDGQTAAGGAGDGGKGAPVWGAVQVEVKQGRRHGVGGGGKVRVTASMMTSNPLQQPKDDGEEEEEEGWQERQQGEPQTSYGEQRRKPGFKLTLPNHGPGSLIAPGVISQPKEGPDAESARQQGAAAPGGCALRGPVCESARQQQVSPGEAIRSARKQQVGGVFGGNWRAGLTWVGRGEGGWTESASHAWLRAELVT